MTWPVSWLVMAGEGEWWAILDADGFPTGEVHRRGSGRWPSGYFHLIVAVCAHREDGAVLITQRAATKEFAFGWEFPGGSALTGETSHQAACRELREETGIDVLPSTLTLVGRFVEASALLDFYTVSKPANTKLELQESEVMAARWVTPEEVTDRLDAGLMAEPWIARLDSLWSPTMRALKTIR